MSGCRKTKSENVPASSVLHAMHEAKRAEQAAKAVKQSGNAVKSSVKSSVKNLNPASKATAKKPAPTVAVKNKKECVLKMDEPRGIFMRGTVLGRGRKYFGENNREVITYKIQCDNQDYFVKDWAAPQDGYFQVGEVVVLPLKVRTFTSKTGVMVDYSVQRENDMVGEAF